MPNLQRLNLAIAGVLTATAAGTVVPSPHQDASPILTQTLSVTRPMTGPGGPVPSPDGVVATPNGILVGDRAPASPDPTSDRPAHNQVQPNPEAPVQERPAMACLTWSDLKADNGIDTLDTVPLLPNMPAGFKNGCTVRETLGLAAVTHVLREEIGLNRVLYPAALGEAREDGIVAGVRGDNIDFDSLRALIAGGDVITYYEACTTVGRQDLYCNDYPQYLPYILPSPLSPDTAAQAACFQGHCLESETISAAELARLWDYWHAPVPAQNQAIRRQYRTLPLDTIFPEPRSVIVSYSEKETLAMNTFGRITLAEGEQPSVVTDEGFQGAFGVVSLVNWGLADDAIGGYRYRIEFESFDGDHVIPVWIGQQQFCRRTHVWTMERCP